MKELRSTLRFERSTVPAWYKRDTLPESLIADMLGSVEQGHQDIRKAESVPAKHKNTRIIVDSLKVISGIKIKNLFHLEKLP